MSGQLPMDAKTELPIWLCEHLVKRYVDVRLHTTRQRIMSYSIASYMDILHKYIHHKQIMHVYVDMNMDFMDMDMDGDVDVDEDGNIGFGITRCRVYEVD